MKTFKLLLLFSSIILAYSLNYGPTAKYPKVNSINIMPGLWKFNSIMPFYKKSETRCIKKSNELSVKKLMETESKCKVLDIKQGMNSGSWRKDCLNEDGTITHIKGFVNYNATTMNEVITYSSRGKSFKLKISGKRVGKCKAKSK
jgi:hypothetical protein